MKRTELNRRDFNKLTAAAFGGIVVGTVVGCGGNGGDDGTGGGDGDAGTDGTDTGDGTDGAASDTGPRGAEIAANNACSGLNQCMNYGKGEHACAGQGSCSTVEAHSCHGQNTCKYLGGCDGTAGTNECAEMGGCGVPMNPSEEAWAQARAAFEKRMMAMNKPFGDPPQ